MPSPHAIHVQGTSAAPETGARAAALVVAIGTQRSAILCVRCIVRALLSIIVLLLVTAGPAQAGKVSLGDATLTFEAERGEANRLDVSGTGAQFTVRDSGARSTDAGPGCVPVSAGAVSCTGDARLISVLAGGRDDVVRVNVPAVFARIDAGAGDDEVSLGTGGGTVLGHAGDDRLFGDSGADLLSGGGGDDTVQGATGDDRLAGGRGRDELDGEDGADVLTGGDGIDVLSGGEGADVLLGGDGGDVLEGGTGADRFDGGAGGDEIIAADAVAEAVACGAGTDSGRADAADELAPGCERLRREGAGPVPVTTMIPFPVIRVVGSVAGSRTTVRRVLVTGPPGTRVSIRCRGRGCPYRRRSRRVDADGSVRIASLERRYRAGARLELFVTAPEQVGKYTRFVMRRRRPPRRTDLCARGSELRAVTCGG
jgi:hypothetical protein